VPVNPTALLAAEDSANRSRLASGTAPERALRDCTAVPPPEEAMTAFAERGDRLVTMDSVTNSENRDLARRTGE